MINKKKVKSEDGIGIKHGEERASSCVLERHPLTGWEAAAVRMGHACVSLSLLVQNELPGEVPSLASLLPLSPSAI